MDIRENLQTIQDTLNHLFRVQSQTSATIIISLSIFVLGFAFTEIIKGIGRIRKRKTIKRILFQCLDNLVLQISAQAKSYISFSETFNLRGAHSGSQYSLQTVNFFPVDVIKQIGYDNLFGVFFAGFRNALRQIFVRERRINAFNQIWACIENAKSWQEVTDSQSKQLIEIINAANSRRESALYDYFDFIAPEIFNAVNSDEIKATILGEYLLEVLKIRSNWNNMEDNTNPIVMHQNLVLPIMQIDNKYKIDVSQTYESSKFLQKAFAGYSEMDRVTNNCKAMYLHQGLSFENYANLITTSKKILS